VKETVKMILVPVKSVTIWHTCQVSNVLIFVAVHTLPKNYSVIVYAKINIFPCYLAIHEFWHSVLLQFGASLLYHT